MLELRDAELERLHRIPRSHSELGAEPRGSISGRVAEPLRLPPPALEDVRERRAQLVPLDAHALGQFVRELVATARASAPLPARVKVSTEPR